MMDPVTRAEKLKQREALQAAYKRTFSTPEGQLVLNDLLKYCRIQDAGVSADPHVVCVLAGARKVGHYLLSTLQLTIPAVWRQVHEDHDNVGY